MTFTEAAAVVLRLVGKPLHYKEITDVAIEKNLLSHVGKSPEVTMGARLNALVKKGEKDTVLVRVKPGVFALREWDEKKIEDGLRDRTPALERISDEDLSHLVQVESDDETELLAHPMAAHAAVDDDVTPPDAEERHRAELSASATELFATEDDDDKPIFGSDDEEESTDAQGGGDAEGDARGGKRRRRRRRGRGRTETASEGDDDLPTYTVSDASPEEALGLLSDEAKVEAPRPPRHERAERERGERPPRDHGERSERDRGERSERDRSERSERDRGERNDGPEFSLDGGGQLPEAGADLASLIEKALSSYDRARGPVPVQSLADGLRRKWKNDGSLTPASVLAVAAADNRRAEAQGKLPRFRVAGNRIAPQSASFDKKSDERFRNAARSLELLRESTLRAVTEQLTQLSHRGLSELVLLVLERLGMTQAEFVRRPGAHGSELHLAATLSLGGFETLAFGGAPLKTAIIVRRDGRDIGRERVTELRGALHHYGPAAHGWLITTGQVLSGAREEAASTGASPVSLTGRNELAELCVTLGIGVRQLRVEVPVLDVELFESLTGR
jgi:HB1, ASXL, restriction endonuclease HTH domain/Restriction endonuclease